MKRLLLQARKGESVIIGYVLLIILAIGMSAAVYSYLRFYIPKDQAKCPEGTSLGISNVTCSQATGSFVITLVNRGLFNIDGAYIKVGDSGRIYKTVINCPGPDQSIQNCQLYFNVGAPLYGLRPLKSGESWTGVFNYNLGTGLKDIEIEPLMNLDNKSRVLCSESIISQKVTCT